MDVKILALPGWQQRVNALINIAPNALHFSYDSYPVLNTVFIALPREPKLAIGWSLGGQLLLRAVAAGHVRPKTLLLLGAPFQCVADAQFPGGMSRKDFDEFKGNYLRAPKETLKGFNALIALGDSKSAAVSKALDAQAIIWENGAFWLKELETSSCRTLDFKSFPKTIIVHGKADKVIDPASAEAFKKALPGAELHLWDDCGHAPHLHDPEKLRKIIEAHV